MGTVFPVDTTPPFLAGPALRAVIVKAYLYAAFAGRASVRAAVIFQALVLAVAYRRTAALQGEFRRIRKCILPAQQGTCCFTAGLTHLYTPEHRVIFQFFQPAQAFLCIVISVISIV